MRAANRRNFLKTASSGAVSLIATPAPAFVLPRVSILRRPVEPIFWQALAVNVAAKWLLQVMTNYGLVPGMHSARSAPVQGGHDSARQVWVSSGYDVTEVYQGNYCHGDLEVSQAIADREFCTFGTLEHDDTVCTLEFREADVFAMRGITEALMEKGYDADVIQNCAYPVHCDSPASYHRYGHTEGPAFRTPSGGTVSWFTRGGGGEQPQMTASIECDDITLEIHSVRLNDEWVHSYPNEDVEQ